MAVCVLRLQSAKESFYAAGVRSALLEDPPPLAFTAQTTSYMSAIMSAGMQQPKNRATIEGRSVRLVSFAAEHIHAYWHLLEEKENVALWRQVYHVEPGTLDEFLATILNTLTTSEGKGMATWTVVDKATLRMLGWATLTASSADPQVAECALFLPRLPRSERGTECIHYIGAVVFEELDFQRLEFRAGTLAESWGPGGGWQGITIIGVLSRQLLDKDRSQESDLYVMTKEQWPAVKAAVKAWLEMKKR